MRTLDDCVAFLRAERKRQHLSQRVLAANAGIPFRTYQRLESGEPGTRLAALLRAFAALGYELQPMAARRPTLDELNAIYGHDED